MRGIQRLLIGSVSLLILLGAMPVAAQTDIPFSLQVTPSPILATLTPGQPTTLELAIRNTGTQTEQLKIEPRAFTANQDATNVTLQETKPPEIAQWLTFSAPNFRVRPGEVFTEKITVNTPKNAGFSYAFALVISRQKELPNAGDSTLRGSVAVFTLLNVDRPDAKRSFSLSSFTSERRIYEYLPATFKVVLKNTGNTIAQPYGSVFIQRSKNDPTPIATIPLNESGGSVLPGTERAFTVQWNDGFPKYITETPAANTDPQKSLRWDWSQADQFRMGKYTAKLVAVYNDGQRDVPLESSIDFWVLPWKLMLVGLMIAGVLLVGIVTIVRNVIRPRRRKPNKQKPDDVQPPHQ